MPQFKAPYVSQRKGAAGVLISTFNRKGYRADLPSNKSEPWFSPEYTQALRASGLCDIKVLRALERLPASLASRVARYKASTKLSASSRVTFDAAARDLCLRFGWMDTRRLDHKLLERIVAASDDQTGTAAVLRRVIPDLPRNAATSPLRDTRRSKATRPARKGTPLRKWTEADLDSFRTATEHGAPERVGLFLMLHFDLDARSAFHMRASDLFQVLHPELEQELAGLQDPYTPIVQQASQERICFTHFLHALTNTCEECGAPRPTRQTLRKLNTDRVVDVVIQSMQA